MSITEIKTEDKIINHIRNVKLLQAIHFKKRFFVECLQTDEGAMLFPTILPNTAFAIKEIQLPNFDLYEEKLGYKWVKTSYLDKISNKIENDWEEKNCHEMEIAQLNEECKRLAKIAEFWQQKYNETTSGWMPPKIDNNPIA